MIEETSRAYLSNFSVGALSLVTRDRGIEALGHLPPSNRTVALLYLMGIRSYELLAQYIQVEPERAKEHLFLGRQKLQERVWER